MDDPALVEAIRSGDPQATRLLVERYHGVVFGLCCRMLNHRHDAEDVTQETFLRALRAIFGFDSARPIRPWLLEIAANRCRTALAVRARRPRLAPVSAAEDRVDPRPGAGRPRRPGRRARAGRRPASPRVSPGLPPLPRTESVL